MFQLVSCIFAFQYPLYFLHSKEITVKALVRCRGAYCFSGLPERGGVDFLRRGFPRFPRAKEIRRLHWRLEGKGLTSLERGEGGGGGGGAERDGTLL